MSGSGSGSATADPPEWAPWRSLLKWAPFKIDALGLVTLLGADEINASVGRLMRSRWLEYLPFLGAYVIAGDRFRQKEPGFNLYNISQGIHTTDFAPWLTRWIKSQHFTSTRNFVRWTVVPPRHRPVDDVIALAISICLLGFLLALTILQYDMYGMGSTLAMSWSVVVRWFMISSVRESIDERVSQMCDIWDENENFVDYVISEAQTYEGRIEAWRRSNRGVGTTPGGNAVGDPENDAAHNTEEPHRLACGWNGQQPVKVLVITSEALAVTMMIPRELMGTRSAFNADLPPHHRFLYGVARWTGWIAFAVQVVTIGQADLVTQICAVALLVIPTVLHIGKFGCDDSNWARNVKRIYRKCLHPAGPRLNEATQVKASREFSPLSVSQIGSRLLAEVYEWPLNHDFVPTHDGDVRRRELSDPRDEERTARRQWLYAWLQLTVQEFESMDKWDLFPHGREDHNKAWFDKYLRLKDLIGELSYPAGTIRQLYETPMIGAQDLIEGSLAATNEAANGTTVEAPISDRDHHHPNGAAVAPETQILRHNLQSSNVSAVAGVERPSPSSPDDIRLQMLPRTGTGFTSATAPGVIRTERRRSSSLARRRHSIHAGAQDRPFRDEPLGSAFMATNLMRNRRQEDRQESDDGSGTQSTKT